MLTGSGPLRITGGGERPQRRQGGYCGPLPSLGRFGAQPAQGASAAPDGELSLSQEGLYQHRADVWRYSEVRDVDTGDIRKEWRRIRTSVECYWQVGTSFQGAQAFVTAESENQLTTDVVHMAVNVDIRAGDVLYQREGPDAGEFWAVRGDPKKKSLMANKLSVETTKLEYPPDGVAP